MSATDDVSKHAKTWTVMACGVALSVFIVDLLVPRGVALGVLYVAAVVLTVRARRRGPVLGVAALATGLALVAVALKVPSPTGLPLAVVVANRAISIGVIWTTAVVVVRHLSAVQRERDAREKASALSRTALDAAPDGMVVVDGRGAIQYANGALHTMLAYPEGALLGKNLEEVVPVEARSVHAEHRRAFAEDPRPRRMGERECRALRRDGTQVLADISLSPVPGDGGLVVAAVRDATERHKLEARERGAQRMEAVGKLAGGIAHDFNNLLAVVMLNATLLRDALDEGDPKREDVREILGATDRAKELTQQLLAFSRRQVTEPRKVDVSALVAEMHKMLRRVLGEDVELVVARERDPWPVEIDPSHFEQVLLNLAVNARHAMPEHGKLTIETTNVTLDEAYAAEHPDVTPGDYVMLAVSDTGIGMTDEVRVRIFEPFFTTRPHGQGTGLGLAMVHGIVKQAGGHIWVYSEPGKGTTFKIYLPRAPGVAEPLPKARETNRPPVGGETILVVEDDPGVRRAAVRALRDAGYVVIEASNGEDALLKLKQTDETIDLLLTDVIMPQMGGRELAAKLQQMRPGLRVLYMSGFTENAIVHRGVLDEGVSLVQKPFTPGALLGRVRDSLDA